MLLTFSGSFSANPFIIPNGKYIFDISKFPVSENDLVIIFRMSSDSRFQLSLYAFAAFHLYTSSGNQISNDFLYPLLKNKDYPI